MIPTKVFDPVDTDNLDAVTRLELMQQVEHQPVGYDGEVVTAMPIPAVHASTDVLQHRRIGGVGPASQRERISSLEVTDVAAVHIAGTKGQCFADSPVHERRYRAVAVMAIAGDILNFVREVIVKVPSRRRWRIGPVGCR